MPRRNLRLKVAILAAGWSQRKTAAACGIRETRFSEICCGWVEPRNLERDAIALALGKSTAELFDEHDEAPAPVGVTVAPVLGVAAVITVAGRA